MYFLIVVEQKCFPEKPPSYPSSGYASERAAEFIDDDDDGDGDDDDDDDDEDQGPEINPLECTGEFGSTYKLIVVIRTL